MVLLVGCSGHHQGNQPCARPPDPKQTRADDIAISPLVTSLSSMETSKLIQWRVDGELRVLPGFLLDDKGYQKVLLETALMWHIHNHPGETSLPIKYRGERIGTVEEVPTPPSAERREFKITWLPAHETALARAEDDLWQAYCETQDITLRRQLCKVDQRKSGRSSADPTTDN